MKKTIKTEELLNAFIKCLQMKGCKLLSNGLE